MPACLIPYQAKESGATLIEINTEPSKYTSLITDVFLHGTATEMMASLANQVTALKTNPA